MFFSKVILPLALVAFATAQHHHQSGAATSYASINNFNTHTSHDYQPHAVVKAAIPVATYQHAAPAAAYHHAPAAYHQTAHAPAPAPAVYHHQPTYHHHAVAAAPVATYHHAAAPALAIKAVGIVKSPVATYNHHEEEAYGHPQYQFKYAVEDKHTGDVKSQEESRDGDVVKGFYTLLQPDGVTRTVHYTSDKHSGFQAHVEYSGHPQQQQVHKAVVAAAPVYKVPAYPHF